MAAGVQSAAGGSAAWPIAGFLPLLGSYICFGLGYIAYMTFVIAWMRDNGPTFVVNDAGEVRGIDSTSLASLGSANAFDARSMSSAWSRSRKSIRETNSCERSSILRKPSVRPCRVSERRASR